MVGLNQAAASPFKYAAMANTLLLSYGSVECWKRMYRRACVRKARRVPGLPLKACRARIRRGSFGLAMGAGPTACLRCSFSSVSLLMISPRFSGEAVFPLEVDMVILPSGSGNLSEQE